MAERFRRELLQSGVRTLYEGRMPYDLADDNHQLLYGMRAQFSAWERGVITRRNFSGHIRTAREGVYVGGDVPYGARLEPTGIRAKSRRYRMVADEAELEIVHELFRRKANGESMPELAAWTCEIGVRPNPYHFLTPGPGLSQNYIFRILKNDFYATGIFRFPVSAPAGRPRW